MFLFQGCSSPLVVKFADTQKEKEQKKIQQMNANLFSSIYGGGGGGGGITTNNIAPQYLAVSNLYRNSLVIRQMFFLPKQCQKSRSIFYSILFYPITLGGRRGTTDEFATIPFHLDLFSAALVELAKSIPVHSLILSSHLFYCLPFFLFPFTVPCRIVFAKPEDLETWPNHLSFRFLTRVRSSSYSPMAAWIFCEPPHW